MSRNNKDEPVFERYRLSTNKKKIRIRDFDTRDKSCFPDRDEAEANAAADILAIAELQNRLYAEGKQALLIVLQATDTGGKDSTIRKVLGPINPQGVEVTSFKAPSSVELAHDYLWRI
ncbi:MAG: polyphosphate kinase 2 family protein, partial [Pseudomonadota bacterium]